MYRKIAVCLLLAVGVFAGQALAQTAFNTGSIYGKAVDANGPLPGVTVTLEAEGSAPKTATTGPGGSYRFTGLVPSSYSLTFSLQGYTELRQEDVKLTAGQTVNLEVTMKQTQEEVVVVSAAGSVVDTKKTSTSSSYSEDYLKNVPSARDPWVILDQTPGVEVDRVNVGGNQSGQQSIFFARGGGSAENGWSYDGVDITDPAAQGATPGYFDFDSFQEIQITTGGQDPAIGTGGVVVSFITKRGTNSWSGQASGYFDNSDLQSGNLNAELLSQNFAVPNHVDQVYEYGGDLGGPIVKDKAWVWGAYRKQDIQTVTALVRLHNQNNPLLNGTLSGGAPQHIILEDVNAKFNVSYNTANEGSFQWLYGNKDFDGRFNFPPNQQSADTTWVQHGPTKMLKAEHSWIPNANLFLDGKFAWVKNDFTLDPQTGIGFDAQPILRLNNDFFLENGFLFYHTFRTQYNLSEDTNYFVQNKWGGDHELKVGFAYKQASVTTSCQYGGDAILYDFAGARGDTSAGFGLAKLRYLINALYDINSLGIYAGDTWRMDRLTLNLGLRFDRSTTNAKGSAAPSNAIAPDLLPALSFPGGDGATFTNWSPRLGATYDVAGDGKTIVRGNYARFYSPVGPTPANFINPIGACVGCYAGLYVYYYDANGDGTVTRDELLDSQYGIYSTIGGLFVGDPQRTVNDHSSFRSIDGDFNGERTQEYLAGVERQLGETMSFSATYIHRDYDQLQAAYIPGLTSSDFTCAPFTVTNPVSGEQFTTNLCDIPAVNDHLVLLNTRNRNRTYNGLELAFNKRMSNSWLLRVSGNIGDQKIHYDDDGTTFGGSFQDPTNIPNENNTWWAQQSNGSGSGGVFSGSRWSFKVSGAYQFPWDLNVGAYFKVIDGNVVPIIRRLSFHNYTNGAFNVLLAPNDQERLQTLKYLDLRVEKGFAVGAYGKLSVVADIFNSLNDNTALRIERRANTFQFREAQEIISPRIVRFGVRYNF